jgi:hypothetical protein
MRHIPLHNRAGHVTGHAMIDDADYERVLAHSWHRSAKGYVAARINGREVYMHRFICGLAADDPRDVDHDNRDRLDNRRANLIPCTRRRNLLNNRGKGYYQHSTKTGWVVMIGRKYLGFYGTEREAAIVADNYRRQVLQREP